ncbi:MAG: outer membrane protein assembly factor BamD [Helicobacteraceae bacterium]|jgi:outer membrane protein assembly factor BamD|nr:outer membrane protein assembly factor BamD [Helicobacteraceae bacterium]
MKRDICSILILGALALGCSQKDISNQSAEYWYRQVSDQIARNNLELAGDRYSSLLGEHAGSPLLAEATLMMAMAHLDAEEYLLANFYLDEYAKRFGAAQNTDRIAYLKLLSDYRGIKRALRDQKLALDAMDKSEAFVSRFGASQLKPYAATINAKTKLFNHELSLKIADLYRRMGKEDAAKYYEAIGAFKPIGEGKWEPSWSWAPKSWFE